MKHIFTRRDILKAGAAYLGGIALYGTVFSDGAEASSANIKGRRTLVIYYSLPESDSSMAEHRENSTVTIGERILGNTQYMAEVIQETLGAGADITRIETAKNYDTTDHAKLIALAQTEQNNNYRPPLKPIKANIDEYGLIFLGYPIWWADLPTPVYSFLERYDLSGKRVIPFGTHGGSGFSNTRETISRLQPNAGILSRDGLTISRDHIQNAEKDIAAWVKRMK